MGGGGFFQSPSWLLRAFRVPQFHLYTDVATNCYTQARTVDSNSVLLILLWILRQWHMYSVVACVHFVAAIACACACYVISQVEQCTYL